MRHELLYQGDPQRKDGRCCLPQHRGLHQAGGYVAVRLQSSQTGGGAAGRDPLTAVAGRVRRAASSTAQTGVERQLAEPAAAPDPAHMELMAHRAGRAGEPGRSAKRRAR
jgi:hypothetical protein